jgi:CheY-like chemotaxis protein
MFDESSGFDNCVEAGTGVEALAKIERQTLNLAVLDFALPDISGLELAKKLIDISPGLPIFVMTTEYNVGVEKKALSNGISAVFSKRDDLATVVANARAVCGID